MRARTAVGLFAVGLLTILIGSSGYGQGGKGSFGPPGGGFGPPGGGFGGRMMGDPNWLFDRFARGRPYFLLTDVNRMRDSLMQYAQEKGVTFVNGQVTREQFAAYSEHMKAKMASGINPMMPPRPPGTPSVPGTPPGTPPQAMTPEALQQMADLDFKSHDQNGDGKLNPEEMPGWLRRDLARWDANKDNLIDLDEYRKAYITRMQERMAGGASPGVQMPMAPDPLSSLVEEDLDKRPVVYRAGKLPDKGLPPWFKQLDTDNDGQVALWEWRQAGKDLAEFKQWDRDDDGFITPEEAMHVQAALTKTADPLVASSNGTPGTVPGTTPGTPPAFVPGQRPTFGPPGSIPSFGKKGNWGGKKSGFGLPSNR